MREGERELIADALRGVPGAFERLALPAADRVWSLLAGMVGATEAEDLLQDAMLRAFRGLGSFRGEAAFESWFVRIAINTARNHLARRRPQTMALPDGAEAGENAAGIADPLDSLPSPAPGPEEAASQGEETARVRAAGGRLSQEEREVVLLRELEGLSYDEIAESLALTNGAVRSRLHRARRRLLGLLGGA